MSLAPPPALEREDDDVSECLDAREAPLESGVRTRCAEDAGDPEGIVEIELDLADLMEGAAVTPKQAVLWSDEATKRYEAPPEVLLERCRRKAAMRRAAPPPSPPPIRRAGVQRRDRTSSRTAAARRAALDLSDRPVVLVAPARRPVGPPRALVLGVAIALAMLVIAAAVWVRASGVL
jgi:hypothetical protein